MNVNMIIDVHIEGSPSGDAENQANSAQEFSLKVPFENHVNLYQLQLTLEIYAHDFVHEVVLEYLNKIAKELPDKMSKEKDE